MTRTGANQPGFAARQLEFAAHIRNPDVNPVPADVDSRRMQVYVDLFFRNVEGLLAGAFPVAKAVLGERRWPALVRRFLHRHGCTTPYFLEISEEFINFLNGLEDSDVPGFMLELCHYEWVELGLDVAEDAALPDDVDPAGDLCSGVPYRSPLAWPLTYAYPVHRIGPAHQPEAPGATPTHLVVYRTGDERVRFMEVNALTQRLLLLLDGERSGAEALAVVADEMPHLERSQVLASGLELMERLRVAGVIVGSRPAA